MFSVFVCLESQKVRMKEVLIRHLERTDRDLHVLRDYAKRLTIYHALMQYVEVLA
jgi:hypothetical protein